MKAKKSYKNGGKQPKKAKTANMSGGQKNSYNESTGIVTQKKPYVSEEGRTKDLRKMDSLKLRNIYSKPLVKPTLKTK